jgi:hypothetical protein
MAEKIAAKDAQLGSIYLTRGGKQLDNNKKECLWGFYPVQILRRENDSEGILKKVVVYTSWGTELFLDPDYPLEATDLQTLPSVKNVNSILTGAKISHDDEVSEKYILQLKKVPETEEVEEGSKKENRNKTGKFENQQILEELKKGTPVKEMVKILKMEYRTIYGIIQQLKKKYRIQKIEKGVFKIVDK